MDRAIAETRTRVGMPMALVRPGAGRLWAHPSPPLTLVVPGAAANPLVGQPSNSRALMGRGGVFSPVSLLTCDEAARWGGEPSVSAVFEEAAGGDVRAVPGRRSDATVSRAWQA